MLNRRYLTTCLIAAAACGAAALFPSLRRAHAEIQVSRERQQPTASAIEDFDSRIARFRDSNAATRDERAAQHAARARLATSVENLKVTWNLVTGTPHVVQSLTNNLTPPDPGGDRELLARKFLREHLELYGVSEGDLSERGLRLSRLYTDPGTGATHVTLQQHFMGIEVYLGFIQLHFTSAGELIGTSGELAPQLERALNATEPTVPAAAAVKSASDSAGIAVRSPLYPSEESPAGNRFTRYARTAEFGGDTIAQLQLLPIGRHAARLVWNVIVSDAASPDVFMVLVDAETSEVLLRNNLTWYQTQPATFRVFTGDSPSPFSPGSPSPAKFQPPFASRVLVTNFPDPRLSPRGWISDDSSTTVGNNADAHLDLNGDNIPDPGLLDLDGRPVSNTRVFDFPLDLSLSPADPNNQRSAVTQLFYLANRYHDLLYDLGFDEAAGNFQFDNFGRGGASGDGVLADVQDGLLIGRINNANFSTLPDGFSGRMQMFVWTGPDPDLDGDFDAEVVFHELTHGLSTRLVAGPAIAGALRQTQSGGLGEGWSDFFGLTLLSEPGDDIDGAYASGAYVTRQLGGADFFDNYYFGIRRYPYSTDMTKNPLTYQMIYDKLRPDTLQTPRSPVIGDPSSEVHAEGEVWCTALWECRANLITQYGFKVGNLLILQLVVDGMKFSPANPNFLEARDAILIADRVRTGGVNQCLLWSAFAKRGMGASASSPPSQLVQGVAEAFDVPPECAGPRVSDSAVSDATGNNNHRLDPGEQDAALTLQLENNTSATLAILSAQLTTTSSGISLPVPTAQFPDVPPRGGRASASSAFSLSVASTKLCGSADLLLHLTTNQGSFVVPFFLPVGDISPGAEQTIFSDNVEQGTNGWSADEPWGITSLLSNSPSNSWADSPVGFYRNSVNTSLSSPILDLSRFRNVSVTCSQWFLILTGSDSGSVEVSNDNGRSWRRAATYSGFQSLFKPVTLDVPQLDGARQARVRFRLSTDGSSTSDGWYIDDIVVRGRPIPSDCSIADQRPTVQNMSFSVLLKSKNNPITLAGSDPKGKPLTFAIARPPAHGSFSGTSPNLFFTPDGLYFGLDSFTYTASNGELISEPAIVSVLITLPEPEVTLLKPAHAGVGKKVTIKGFNLQNVVSIMFGTVVQGVYSVAANGKKITTTVPSGAFGGSVDIISISGRVIRLPFTVDI